AAAGRRVAVRRTRHRAFGARAALATAHRAGVDAAGRRLPPDAQPAADPAWRGLCGRLGRRAARAAPAGGAHDRAADLRLLGRRALDGVAARRRAGDAMPSSYFGTT